MARNAGSALLLLLLLQLHLLAAHRRRSLGRCWCSWSTDRSKLLLLWRPLCWRRSSSWIIVSLDKFACGVIVCCFLDLVDVFALFRQELSKSFVWSQ